MPTGDSVATSPAVHELPDDTLICQCRGVTKAAVAAAVRGGHASLASLGHGTAAGTGLCDEYGKGFCDLTTRQQIQLRWFGIGDVPALWDRLAAVGLHSKQTGMDNVRGVCGCPLAGVAANELFDATPVARAFTERVLDNKAFTNLPRKF